MAINADGSIHTEGAVAADPFMNLLFQAAMGLIEKKEEGGYWGWSCIFFEWQQPATGIGSYDPGED